MYCKKNQFTKEYKLRRKYLLNLLNEPQHLAEIKAPKLLKFPSEGVTNLRERKLKNNWLKLRENKLKVREKCLHHFFNVKVKILWRDWLICKITRAAREYKKNIKRERKRKTVTWNLKTKEIFYMCLAFLKQTRVLQQPELKCFI